MMDLRRHLQVENIPKALNAHHHHENNNQGFLPASIAEPLSAQVGALQKGPITILFTAWIALKMPLLLIHSFSL